VSVAALGVQAVQADSTAQADSAVRWAQELRESLVRD